MHKLMTRAVQGMAILGGLTLGFLILMVCVSVTGRGLNTFFHSAFMESFSPGFSAWALGLGVGPVLGDFELVENMMPFAIFAFLPLAHVTSSHATVDVFTARFPPPVLRFMRAVTEIIFAAVLILLAWKLYEGTVSKMQYGEITYLIQFPVWWAFAGALVAAVFAAVVAVYMSFVRIREMVTGHVIAPDGPEAEH